MTSRHKLYAAGEPFGDSATRVEGGRLICGGGGSKGPDNYANLEKLYGEQTESARLLRQMSEANLPGSVSSFMNLTNEYLDPSYRENQAAMAASDMISANAMERAATNRNLASMGVNPNDPRFASAMRSTELGNAARLAAGQNAARNDARSLQLAVAKDAVGTFTGQSNMAAQQMSNASGGMANLASQQQQAEIQKQNQRSQNISNAVGGSMAAFSMFKDGGKVYGLEKHMLGGIAGQQTPPPPPKMAPPPPHMSIASTAQMLQQGKEGAQFFRKPGTFSTRMAARGAENTDRIGRMVGKFSQDAGSNISSQAAGMRMADTPAQASAARDAYVAAAQQAADPAVAQQYMNAAANISEGAGLGSTVTASSEAAGAAAAGAEAAGGLASVAPGVAAEVGTAASGLGAAGGTAGSAATGAALTGTASAGAGAMATIGAALPWVGAAVAVGSLLGLFKDGGRVGDYENGGKVPGKWQGNTDTVPALLTEQEHVVNAEAAKMIGHDKLEKLNKKGLEQRKKGKSPDKVRTIGLGALT